MVALFLMKTAQPALLYLVPTTLGSIVLLALCRGEFRLFFTDKVSCIMLSYLSGAIQVNVLFSVEKI